MLIIIKSIMFNIIILISLFSKYSYANGPYIKGTYPQPFIDQNIGDQCFRSQSSYKYKYEPCDPNSLYRTYDGSCNNLKYPWWGMTYAPIVRLMPAEYADKKQYPRMSVTGHHLPNARTLRTQLLTSKSLPDDLRYWTLLISWTQFISHDTGRSVPKKKKLDCCSPGYYSDTNTCMPILVGHDPFYRNNSVPCLNMVRGLTTEDMGCPLGSTEQVIDVTHFMDASTIYGSNKDVAFKVRLFKGGLLKAQQVGGKEYPPNLGNPKSACDVQPKEPPVCYFAGDVRVNQNSYLTSLQILFLRMHNKIAREFSKVNPHWNDEKIYQEARKTNIGIIQWITYEEVLPALIGQGVMNKNYLKTNIKTDKYRDDVNPATINEFQTAAYRSLHSIVPGAVWLISHMGMPAEIDLVKWMNRPSIVQGYFDHVLEGLQTQFIQPQDKEEDPRLNNNLKNENPPFKYTPTGEDLGAISIQRQRDYGMPGYNQFRKYAGLPVVKSFEQLSDVMSSANIKLLKKSYSYVDDIDLIVGGYMERPIGGSLFGPTFTYVVAEQFYRWKFGDRHFFSFLGQPWSFTKAQYNEIVKSTTGWLFCEGGNDFHWVHINIINNAILGNQLMSPCFMLPKLDYTKWKDTSYSNHGSVGKAPTHHGHHAHTGKSYAINVFNPSWEGPSFTHPAHKHNEPAYVKPHPVPVYHEHVHTKPLSLPTPVFKEPAYVKPAPVHVHHEPVYTKPLPIPVFKEPAYVNEPVYTKPLPIPVFKEPAYKKPAPVHVYHEPVHTKPLSIPVFKEPAYLKPAPVQVYHEHVHIKPLPTPVFKEPAYVNPHPLPVYAKPVPAPVYKEAAYEKIPLPVPAYQKPAYVEPLPAPKYIEPAYENIPPPISEYQEPAYVESLPATVYKEPAYESVPPPLPEYKEVGYAEPIPVPKYNEPAYENPPIPVPEYQEPAYVEPVPEYKEPVIVESTPEYNEPVLEPAPEYKAPALAPVKTVAEYKEPINVEPVAEYEETVVKPSPTYKEPVKVESSPEYEEHVI